MATMQNIENELWQIVIFMVDNKANHCGLSLPGNRLADLSLRGARVISWDAPAQPKGEKFFFDITVPEPSAAEEFLEQPGELARLIRKEEKKFRGWHLTKECPDFVRTFHTERSLNPDDMNCVEWIVRALELGGVSQFHSQVLTPAELHAWCRDQKLTET